MEKNCISDAKEDSLTITIYVMLRRIVLTITDKGRPKKNIGQIIKIDINLNGLSLDMIHDLTNLANPT